MIPLSEALPDATPDDLFQLEQAFPEIECPYDPLGIWCVVQDKSVVEKTKGGIYLADTVKEANEWQESVGRVLAMGPMCFHDELSSDPNAKLPGWEKLKPGSIVLCSRLSSTRQRVCKVGDVQVVVRLIPYKDVMACITSTSQVLR